MNAIDEYLNKPHPDAVTVYLPVKAGLIDEDTINKLVHCAMMTAFGDRESIV